MKKIILLFFIFFLYSTNFLLSQSYDCENVYLTINKNGIYRSNNESFFQPTSGHKYYYLDITVLNNRQNQISYNLFDFTLKDEEGYQYTPTFCDLSPAFGSGYLSPSEKARGFVVFEVLINSNGYKLLYQPDLFSTTYKIDLN